MARDVMNQEPMVIGAGLCRTGTKSLKTALELILEGRCHHFFDILWQATNKDMMVWNEYLSQGRHMTPEQWRHFFAQGQFKACVDIPMSLHFEELLEVFPKAKVILTVRDPEGWFKSMKSVLLDAETQINTFPLKMMTVLLGKANIKKLGFGATRSVPPGFQDSMSSAVEQGPGPARVFFEAWSQHVRQRVPQDRLLVFNVKEGWEPLCQFLNVPVPSVPFPRENDSHSVKATLRLYTKIGWAISILTFCLSAVLAFVASFFFF